MVVVLVHVHQHGGVVDVADHVADILSAAVVESVGHQGVGASQLGRGEVEALAPFLLVLLEQARELLALLASVGRSLERTETVDVQPGHALDRVLEDLQIGCLEEQAIVHREVARAILQLADRSLQIRGDLRSLALGRGRPRLVLLVAVEVVQLLGLLGVLIDPLLVHALDLLEHHSGDPFVQAVRDPVDTPERGEVVVGGVVMEEREHTGDRDVRCEVVRTEHILLAGLERKQVGIAVEVALELLHLLATLPPVLLRLFGFAFVVSSVRSRLHGAGIGDAGRSCIGIKHLIEFTEIARFP